MVNEKRYGRRSRPETSYSEDLYSADDESMIDSRPESRLSDSHFTTEADRLDSSAVEVRFHFKAFKGYQGHNYVWWGGGGGGC